MHLKIAIFFFMVASCSQKDNCSWVTVSDLDKIDVSFQKCNADSMFLYMQKFSGGYDSMRRVLGIPPLPKHFEGRVFTVDNQVQWLNMVMRNKAFGDSLFKQPFMNSKIIEWSGDTLKYEITTYWNKNDHDKSHVITYYLDTLKNDRTYLFQYLYSDDSFAHGKQRTVTKLESDSILKMWRLNY